jgi:glutamine synthetase
MKYVAEYIWPDSKGNMRSKSKTIDINVSRKDVESPEFMKRILHPKNYPEWSYDGSSTQQSLSDDSEVILKPVEVFTDPFRKLPNVMVLCETYRRDGIPMPSNTRFNAVKEFKKHKEVKPWFGIEQEFYIMNNDKFKLSTKSTEPIGTTLFVNDLNAVPQGQYYCSVGGNNAFGRKIAEQAFHYSLEAGLKCSGMNSEVGPGQWEIQVGPCEGIEAGDQLLILRYILNRVSEIHNVQINIDPKPLVGDWNGSGCHVNFSTKDMREAGGYSNIINAIEKLSEKHTEHLQIYGENNDKRLTGNHETSKSSDFSYGIGDRTASVRIPQLTAKEHKGYFEDRRPGANMDPYLVTSKILSTTMG